MPKSAETGWQMNVIDWKTIVESIGIVSVVASMLFVGFQIEQSKDIALAGHYLEQAALVVEATAGRMQNERYMRERGQRHTETGAFSDGTAR
jgi:hypothetical protein